MRDVLVGTMRSPQQLDICRKHCFYYIPAERLQDSDFPIRYVALYQSQYVFGAQAGVRYYGEVTKCSAVRRSAITEVSPRRGTEGNFYYRFDIREWKQLNRPIEAKETGFVRDFTNLFLLEHSVQTPELWLRTEEEYRLCSALKRAVWGDTINEPDNGLAFEFRGFTVSFAEGKIFVSDEGRAFARYEISHFLQDPGAVGPGHPKRMPPEGFHEGTLEDLNRSYYLLLHSCGALLDELLGDAGAAASGTDGEGFGLGQQLVVGHLDAVLFGKLGEDDLEPGFLRPLEGDGEAEPGRKAHQLLTGVGLVDVIAGAVGEGFLDKVAAVGGSVNGDVPGSAAHAALEDGFQGRKVVVVGREAQIVDEEDELQWVRGQLVHQIGDLIELVLLDFHEAQAVGGELVGDGLDGAGLARTGVAVE